MGLKITMTLLFCCSFISNLHAQNNSDTKQNLLNAVTTTKAVQQIILDYLDITDQLVKTYTVKRRKIDFAVPVNITDTDLGLIHQTEHDSAKSIELRDLLTGTKIRKVDCIPKACLPVKISDDGRYFLLCEFKNATRVSIWNKRELVAFETEAPLPQSHIFSPRNTYLAAINKQNQEKVLLFTVQNGTCTHLKTQLRPFFYCATNTYVHQMNLAFSPDEQNLAVSNLGCSINIIEIGSKKVRQFKSEDPNRTLVAHEYSPDGKSLMCLYTSIIIIYDIETGMQLAKLPNKTEPVPFFKIKREIAYCPNGHYIAIARNSEPSVIEFRTPNLEHIIATISTGFKEGVGIITFLQNGKYFSARSRKRGKEFQIKIFKSLVDGFNIPAPTKTQLPEINNNAKTCVIS